VGELEGAKPLGVIRPGFKTRFGIFLSLARRERGEYQARAEIAEHAEKNAVDRPPSGPIREKEGGRRHFFFARSADSARNRYSSRPRRESSVLGEWVV